VALALLGRSSPAVLVVPVALGSDPLALLVVAGQGPFHDVDRAAASAFGNQAALALEVARAQDDQRRLALFEERDRIARDLHDSVIQRLFGTGLRMQGLRELVAQPSVERQLGEFVDDLDTTIRDIRRTIFDLRDAPEPGPVSCARNCCRPSATPRGRCTSTRASRSPARWTRRCPTRSATTCWPPCGRPCRTPPGTPRRARCTSR
jgi:hypothetical protein